MSHGLAGRRISVEQDKTRRQNGYAEVGSVRMSEARSVRMSEVGSARMYKVGNARMNAPADLSS